MSTSGVPEQSKPQESRGFTDYSVIYESENGYSILYKVQKNGKWFALKGVKNEPGAKAKYESVLRREFDLHKNVTSIYCAECYELINDPNVGLCIVMQYVDGITLNEWLKQKPSATEKSRVLNELLEAIGELHLKQIIHQDIKPSNIIITNNGHHVKLIDYGLSDNDAYISRARGYTNRYASPELKAGGNVTFASDIWSLGSVINDLFPHRYRAVKSKCRKQYPQDRYKSVNALRKALSKTDTVRKTCLALVLVLAVAAPAVYLAQSDPL
ncbi:MAG: protein kinase [Bacteroidales bacterium]|nr:protein kinase [Bacteroidales bacterium]MDY6426504.1 protein kinase [Bacteroidales bacterium]